MARSIVYVTKLIDVNRFLNLLESSCAGEDEPMALANLVRRLAVLIKLICWIAIRMVANVDV